MRLTDVSLRALPLQAKGSKKYWDENTPGFGVRCSAKSKSFIVMFGKDRRLVTLGKYPDMSLRTARQEAKLVLAAKPRMRSLKGTRETISVFLDDANDRLRHNTLREYRRHLDKAPEKQLADITRRDIDLGDPQAIKTWKAFFNWCVRNEITDRNPFQHIPVVFGERSRVLNDDELRQVWLYDYPPYSDYLKLQILTGQRIGQWKNYTCKDQTIVFEAEGMKGKREHVIPLTDAVSKLLPVQPFNGWSNAKRRLDRHVPLEPWTIHDLRRTFSTNCAALGVPLHVTERILDHRSGTVSGVAAVYNRHTYMPEMREAFERYERRVKAIAA
ncbi:tyrosine-type recombinase/integrase [Tropicimonas sp. S265A]|uniref:tyrosine-type recombinase/integrase n=1 Tax=Tropicimonas sp. S265A TaxID=3415134 RepID=UPI003C7CDAF8